MIQFDQNDVELREIIGHSMEDLATALTAMEASIDLGKSARVTLCTESLPTDEILDNLYLGMVAGGCHVSQPTAMMVEGVPTTEFVLRKGSPVWTMLIPLLIPLATMGLISFGIGKIESIGKALLPLILVTVGGLVIIVAMLRRPAEKFIETGGVQKLLPSVKAPRGLEQKVKGLWEKACKWDKIPPESKFVVFSDDNPHLKEYNEAVGQLQRFKSGEWKPAVTKNSKKAVAVK